MFILLLVLTAASGIAMVVGFSWLLAGSGQTTRKSGPEVGAEVMAGMAEMEEDDAGVASTLAERSAFKGSGVKVESEVSVSFADIKASMRAGGGAGVPALLAMGGLSGLLAFGSLTLLAGWRNLIAVVVVIGVFYCLARIWIGFARA